MEDTDPFFDESPQPGAAEEFPFDELDRDVEHPDSVEETKIAYLRRKVVSEFCDMLTAYDATPLQAGQRLFLLKHKMKLSGFKTMRELAERMGVSPGRASQIAKAFDVVLTTENIGDSARHHKKS